MRILKLAVLACFVTFVVWTISPLSVVEGRDQKSEAIVKSSDIVASTNNPATEAPTGFDNQTNGMTDQATFEADEEIFDELEEVDEGLGPVFNARGCGECHANPVVGSISQISELRAGHFNGSIFIDHPGDSLIHSRAIDVAIQEQILPGNEVRTFRMTTNTLGAGFIEAIDSNVLFAISQNQPFASGGRIRGQFIQVPVIEANGALRGGRFGWKNQHASLVSFSADAYLNEMGITTPFLPNENTSNGNSVEDFDEVPDPEDDGEDVLIFARFMRATKAPPRDAALAATSAAQQGEQLFNQIGCAICHVPTFVTAPAGTVINGGEFVVPPALGNKIIHPFGDFLLHDVGTGDGIVQNGGQSTRNKIRTVPLWGLRARNRLMHDGLSLTVNDAILRHAGEATFVINNYRALSTTQRNRLLTFLRSL
jgi:CxxC motif-containing protein (DUF1111 family)